MIRKWRIEFEDASAYGSSLDFETGVCECHMVVRTCPGGSFEKQLDRIHSAFAEACSAHCSGLRPVFVRYFLSDVANQEGLLRKMCEGRYECPVSVIEQPPLDGTKVSAWAILQSDKRTEEQGYRHMWLADSRFDGGDSESQTGALLEAYDALLTESGCNMAENCLRTWFFVQDVDLNYAGVVKGRKDMFDRIGLTEDTHYIASTGIAGRNAGLTSLVTMDAYAVSGLEKGQVTYLKGASHLNPTHEYGVTFERGTAVNYGDRRHVLISGTASIDNTGAIVSPGDISRQTLRMLENVEVPLDEAGCTYDDVMHMIVYLRDIADYPEVKGIYDDRFPEHAKVFVWAPVCRPGWLIEMECMAVKAVACNGYKNF